MNDAIEIIREKYKGFKKGEEGVFTLRNQVHSALEVAIKEEDAELAEELEDMLIDLEFSLQENKCNCHKDGSIC